MHDHQKGLIQKRIFVPIIGVDNFCKLQIKLVDTLHVEEGEYSEIL